MSKPPILRDVTIKNFKAIRDSKRRVFMLVYLSSLLYNVVMLIVQWYMGEAGVPPTIKPSYA